MKIIKVDAIGSTNSFLKAQIKESQLDNFTVVVTDNQTKGKGQQGASWESDAGKNLTFSVFTDDLDLAIQNQFVLSMAVALALKKSLVNFLPNKIAVKWPNDILADKQKIAGVLIENTVRKGKIENTIIGIGLNVNQEVFALNPNATSMKLLANRNFNLEEVLNDFLNVLRHELECLKLTSFDLIEEKYLMNLYNFKKPAMYKSVNGELFMAKIIGIDQLGRLQLELEDESKKSFDLKEVKQLL